LIFHNTALTDEGVVRKYFEKDMIEKSFKKLKGVLSLRPIRVWLTKHIKGHVKICYLAYSILSFLNYKIGELGITGKDALEILKNGYRVKLKDSKTGLWETIVTLKKMQEKILRKIGCSV